MPFFLHYPIKKHQLHKDFIKRRTSVPPHTHNIQKLPTFQPTVSDKKYDIIPLHKQKSCVIACFKHIHTIVKIAGCPLDGDAVTLFKKILQPHIEHFRRIIFPGLGLQPLPQPVVTGKVLLYTHHKRLQRFNSSYFFLQFFQKSCLQCKKLNIYFPFLAPPVNIG